MELLASSKALLMRLTNSRADGASDWAAGLSWKLERGVKAMIEEEGCVSCGGITCIVVGKLQRCKVLVPVVLPGVDVGAQCFLDGAVGPFCLSVCLGMASCGHGLPAANALHDCSPEVGCAFGVPVRHNGLGQPMIPEDHVDEELCKRGGFDVCGGGPDVNHLGQAIPPSQPGQAQNNPQRVQANPLDLGRAQPPATPIQLEGRLNGRPVKFMLDSGAMGNFLSSEWLQQSGMRAAPRLSDKILQLPNGSQIPSHHFLPQAAIQLSSARASCPHMQERLHFDVADLQGYDAILGKPWLDKHNPTIDWKKHMVSVHKNGKTFVMQQRKPAIPSHAQRSAQDVKRDLLSAKQMQRLMRKKQGTFFVAYIDEAQDLNATASARQPISSATASSSHQ